MSRSYHRFKANHGRKMGSKHVQTGSQKSRFFHAFCFYVSLFCLFVLVVSVCCLIQKRTKKLGVSHHRAGPSGAPQVQTSATHQPLLAAGQQGAGLPPQQAKDHGAARQMGPGTGQMAQKMVLLWSKWSKIGKTNLKLLVCWYVWDM